MKYSHKVFDAQVKKDLLDCNGMTILGKLSVQGTPNNQKSIRKAPRTEYIAIMIEPISFEPKPLIELREIIYKNNSYMALDKDQPSFVINDLTYSSKNMTEKINHWHDMLKGQFVVFKTHIEIVDEKVTLKVEIQSIEPANKGSLANRYLEIPHTRGAQEILEYALYHRRPIEFTDYSHFYDAPRYFIGDDYLYYHFPLWKRATDHIRSWILSDAKQNVFRVKLASIKPALGNDLVETACGLTFLNVEAESDLKLRLVEFGEAVPVRKTLPIVENQSNSSVEKQKLSFDPKSVRKEHTFLDELQGLTLSENLLYDRKDLVNFHISLKINPLTVVAGMSGTGKTRLANAYAKMLGLTEKNGGLLFLPISPSYLEPNDVLGYLNPSSGYFVPSETGLVDLLVRADRTPDKMHMVIFDEMNLSQVEHWFAPFLSILEKPENDRLLHLYSDANTCHNADFYPASVNIGANVLFVGTINLDETTKELSDRLLDRINLVTLRKSDFVQFSTLDLEKDKYNGVVFTFNDVQSWKSTSFPMSCFRAKELQYFDELHKLISKYDTQKGVSFRFLNRLGHYIQNIPLTEKGQPELHRTKAIDISIKQGLLTKIKGSKQQIGNLIGEITDPEAELINSELFNFINDNRLIKSDDFKGTREEIKRKALELGLYGYTN